MKTDVKFSLAIIGIVISLFFGIDTMFSSESFIVGDLKEVVSVFDPNIVQEYHIAKVELNTFGYDEEIDVPILSDMAEELTPNSKIVVGIQEGYFTSIRYSVIIR